MKTLRLGLFLFLGLLSTVAWAKEGSDQYPNGAENWFAGFLPPAGNYYVNYFGYYGGDLKNDAGQKPLLNGTTPTVSATFDVLRYVQITPLRLFGANDGMHVIVPVVYQSVDLNGTASKTSIGDITVNPLIFGWHRPAWHAIAALDVMLPTGYAVVQTKDDTVSGQVAPAAPGLWDSGRRGQVVSIGPSVGYNNSRHMIFAADWQHETELRIALAATNSGSR